MADAIAFCHVWLELSSNQNGQVDLVVTDRQTAPAGGTYGLNALP
jgi:hypothetical protein